MTETISIDDRAGDLLGAGFAAEGEIIEFFAGAEPSIDPPDSIFPQFAEASTDEPIAHRLSERSLLSDEELDVQLGDLLEVGIGPADVVTAVGDSDRPENSAPSGNGIFVPFEPSAPFVTGLTAEGVLPAT